MIWIRNTVVCLIIGVISLNLLISCSPYTQNKTTEYHERLVPPNCIEISDNYFIDKSDIKNIDYLEFLFWNERIFGAKSPEYQFLLSDSIKQFIPEESIKEMMAEYLISLNLDGLDKPLSKISYEQFKKYSEWRTDRVYEMMLSRFSIMDYDTAQTSGHYFSIANYFSGIYLGYKPDTILAFIPEYSIPNPEDISMIKRNKTFISKTKSPWTGYRNVCRWVRIGK